MYFIDRVTLGGMLADRLSKYKGKGAVIICLKESSLLTCLTMAVRLRAWVYPLVFVPVYGSGLEHSALGAFDQDGEFCHLPNAEDSSDQASTVVAAAQKPRALAELKNETAQYGIALHKHVLNGRDVILAGDVLTDQLSLIVAQQLLKHVSPKSLTTIIGNVTPEVAELARLSAERVDILDILSGIVFDDGHYFERQDTYTLKQKYALTQQIAAYWQ